MPLSRRYSPEWAPDETATIGMDFSPIIPPGVGIVGAVLAIQTNTQPAADASADWVGEMTSEGAEPLFVCTIHDRTIYAKLSGGVEGRDYRFVWYATDTDGNNWPRSALLLCAYTS